MAGRGGRAADARAGMRRWLAEYAYLVTLGAVIAVIAAAAMYTRSVNREREAGLQAAAQAAEIAQTPAPTPLPTLAPGSATITALRGRTDAVRPVTGEIIRGYAGAPVYWEALACFKTHEAADLRGEAGEPVYSMREGVVQSAAMDALWGWRVTIAHADGSTGVYAGLAQAAVQAGQSVGRGAQIGVLMPTIPCEAELGAHLHLEILRGGKPDDPQTLLPAAEDVPANQSI